jgi:hypothetical protein
MYRLFRWILILPVMYLVVIAALATFSLGVMFLSVLLPPTLVSFLMPLAIAAGAGVAVVFVPTWLAPSHRPFVAGACALLGSIGLGAMGFTSGEVIAGIGGIAACVTTYWKLFDSSIVLGPRSSPVSPEPPQDW